MEIYTKFFVKYPCLRFVSGALLIPVGNFILEPVCTVIIARCQGVRGSGCGCWSGNGAGLGDRDGHSSKCLGYHNVFFFFFSRTMAPRYSGLTTMLNISLFLIG